MTRVMRNLLGFGLLLIAGAGIYGLQLAAERQAGVLMEEQTVLEARQAQLTQRIASWQQAQAEVTLPESMVRRAADGTAATLAIQQLLVALAAEHRLALSSFGAVPLSHDLPHEIAAVELEGRADLSRFAGFLAALEEVEPRLAVSNLTLRALPARGAEAGVAPVSLRLVVWGLWSPGEG
jgi:hypothetical protein